MIEVDDLELGSLYVLHWVCHMKHGRHAIIVRLAYRANGQTGSMGELAVRKWLKVLNRFLDLLIYRLQKDFAYRLNFDPCLVTVERASRGSAGKCSQDSGLGARCPACASFGWR